MRNRVIEVKRFANVDNWYYIDSKNMIADVGTRKDCQIEDIDQSAKWINGFDWL